jgi:hypothetical protein
VIYFLTPDAARPSGGTRQIYLMVDLLRDLGYEAAVFHGEPGFRCAWFDNETAVVAQPRLRLDQGDVLVVPEYAGARERARCGDASVVVLNQNHFRTFINVAEGDVQGVYPGWPNAKAVLVTSKAIERFMGLALRDPVPVFLTRVVVDDELFTPREKRQLIALMSRKRGVEGATVVNLVRRMGVTDWDIVRIGQVAQSEVAALLAETAIFLSFSSEEGFGLPPAEAMAAGCYVIGYTGDGGREFMNPDWCSPIADQDVVTFAYEVGRIVRSWENDRASVQRVANRGRDFVNSTYTRAKLRSDLDRAFASITATGSGALQPHAVQIIHWSVPLGPRGALTRTSRWLRRAIAR